MPARITGRHYTAYLKNREGVLKTQSVCGICGQVVDKSLRFPDPMSATVDHIIPINKGGHPSDPDNLQLAHFRCNRLKSDKTEIEEYRKNKQAEEVRNTDLPQSMNWAMFTVR